PFTDTTTSAISSTQINTVITGILSSVYFTVTIKSTKYTETNLISASSNSLSVTIGTASVMSTPVSTLQSTDSNTLLIAESFITAVFILLVITILVILMVSVLVCRKIWDKTSNGDGTSSSDKIKADINQQPDGSVYWIHLFCIGEYYL
uniref:Uncharacterized protein n=1 Tax=Amphimedon queenslandica TaxID=400682 RepID=A0A1X7UIR3_AMPQE